MKKSCKSLLVSLCFIVLLSAQSFAGDPPDEDQTTLVKLPEPFRKISLKNADWSSNTKKRLQETLDKFVAHPMTAQFVSNQFTGDLRDGLDRKVTLELRALPQYEEIRSNISRMLNEEIEINTTKFMASFAQASKEQYSQYLAMVKRVSERLQFAPQDRRRANVFVETSPEMNAFAYSAKTIHFVILQGLVDRFEMGAKKIVKDPAYQGGLPAKEVAMNAVEAVIGHELGHIRAEHVLNQAILVAVLRASLKQQDGDISQEAESEDAQNRFDGVMRSALLRSLRASRMMSSAKNTEADELLASKLYVRLKSLRMNLKGLSDFRGKFLEKNESVEETVNQMNAFLNKYSRSCETTADRMGQVSTSTLAAQHADMLLVGATNMKAAKKAARALADRVSSDPEQMKALLDGSHPMSLYRILQYEMNEKDPMMKIYTTPYLTALHYYFAVSKYMEEGLQRAQDNDELELPQMLILSATIEKYEQFENALGNLIAEELWEDVQDFLGKKGRRMLETVEETAKYLGYREVRQRFEKRSPLNSGIATRTGFRNGLFGRLGEKLMELPDQNQRKLATEILLPVLTYIPDSRITSDRSALRQKAAEALDCNNLVHIKGQESK